MAGIRTEDGKKGLGSTSDVERADHISGISALDADTCQALVCACLKNRWLVRGIEPTRRNTQPLESFSFFNSDSLDALLAYFRSGPHELREGVVFFDLAFVQQVDFGDEWLVLKRAFDSESGENYWIPFESYSLERIIKSRSRFECAIEALREADPYDIAALLSHNEKNPIKQRQGRAIS